MGDLEGRVAVITAAASGIGRASALLFAREGARVVVIDINPDAASTVVSEIEHAGGAAEALRVDMTKVGEIRDVVARIEGDYGRLDVLFNHVGGPTPRGFDFDEQSWREAVDLNLTAPAFMTKAAWPLMQKSGAGGSILFTSSISGLVASRNSAVYSALKAAVIGFMRTVSAMGGEFNIRANALCPGATDTPMLPDFFTAPGESASVVDQRLAAFVQTVPLGRMCRPEEVAELALFLASDRSSYITGTAMPIDGGYGAL